MESPTTFPKVISPFNSEEVLELKFQILEQNWLYRSKPEFWTFLCTIVMSPNEIYDAVFKQK